MTTWGSFTVAVRGPKVPKQIVNSPSNKLKNEKWYDDNIHSYKSLAAMVSATLKSALDGENISYVDIPFREKKKASFLNKIADRSKSKNYQPTDMTDLAGIRVITLIESDVHKVGDIIDELFKVHPEDSINKSESLGDDKVGYRSVHYVCDIGEHRECLPEWKKLKNLCFEIQVRTALEHAWAEIEHDRGYKLGGKLPSHLIRRFSLLSASLEAADLEFNRLTVEIEKYIDSVKKDIEENNDFDTEITTVGIKALINHIFSDITYFQSDDGSISKIIKDLNNLNITNLNALKKILANVKEYFYNNESRTEVAILRTALLYNDIEKYMSEAWVKSDDKWKTIPKDILEILSNKYKDKNLPNLFMSYDIQIH